MICEHLVKRFKEHDATVKEEILLATRDMLGEIMRTQGKGSSGAVGAASPISPAPESDEKGGARPPLLKRQSSLVAALESKWSDIVDHCDSQYKAAGNLPRTRQVTTLSPLLCSAVLGFLGLLCWWHLVFYGCSALTFVGLQAIFLLLRELVLVNENVQEYLPKIMPHVLVGMKATGKHLEAVPGPCFRLFSPPPFPSPSPLSLLSCVMLWWWRR